MIEALYRRRRRLHAVMPLDVLMGALWFRLRLDAWRRRNDGPTISEALLYESRIDFPAFIRKALA